MNRIHSLTITLLVTLAISPGFSLMAQDDSAVTADASEQSEPAQPPLPPTCERAEHHQFDFWIGTWDVTSDGKPAGRNVIKPVHNHCALSENWQSASGPFAGSSVNIYDRATGRWHQTWVDTTGTLLLLEGGLENGSMVLSGQRPGREGGTVTHRITWTPNEDGSVRQHWQAHQGDGEWATLFDGLYKKAE